MSLSSQFDPFYRHEGIEFEHHGAGWGSDEDEGDISISGGFGSDVPTTHGTIHLPGNKRIMVEGRWNKLQAADPEHPQRAARPWEDFRFHALAEIEDDYDAPLMDIGVMHAPGRPTPERPEGGGMVLSGRPVGVHLPETLGTPAGYYPVEPPHSKVHTEGAWHGADQAGVGPGRIGGKYKEVRRWAQDPGGEPQGPRGGHEFGTTITEQVRQEDLVSYRRGDRGLAQQSVGVRPIEQLTDPRGVATLASTTGDFYDFFTAELDRYMHHLRGGSDEDYFKRGTHGQDMPGDRGGRTADHPWEQPTSPYRKPSGDLGENPGIPPEASSEERGLLTEAEGPDDFDGAVLKHGDLALVAEEMRDTMPQWVLEERLLGEINKRTTLVGDEFKQRDWWQGGGNLKEGMVAPGVTLEAVTKSGDHLELARRGQHIVRERKRRANESPEQREEQLVKRKKSDVKRSANRTPEQREEYLASERKRNAKRRAAKKGETT